MKFSNPPTGVAIFHDTHYKEENVDVEVQSDIEGNYINTPDIKFFNTPRVQVASVTFHGNYDQMAYISQAIAKWIEDNNYRMNGPMFNIYHVSPAEDANSDNWITEACYQVISN